MGFDMNNGYCGWSMSRRAAAAYDDGEKPKSKWTKAAILAAVEECCDDNDRAFAVPKATKAELFDRFIEPRGWHHTSKLCNRTDFYGVDEDAVIEAFPPMTADRLAAREAERERAEAERIERLAREAARREADREFARERGYERGSVAHYMACRPDGYETFRSRSGREYVRIVHDGTVYQYEARRAAHTPLWWWDHEAV